MQQPIDKINLSVRNGRGKVIQNGSTANIMIDTTPFQKPIISGGSSVKPFRIVSDGSGNGIYNCYEMSIDKTDWNNSFNPNVLEDKNATSVEVFNASENGVSASHVLSTNDILIAFSMVDDEGNSRWVGWSPKFAWWHA